LLEGCCKKLPGVKPENIRFGFVLEILLSGKIPTHPKSKINRKRILI